MSKSEIKRLAEKVEELQIGQEKLKHKVKKVEKGVVGEEKSTRTPSSYNDFISKHIGEMSGKDPQTRFKQVVELWHKEHDGKKRKT